MQDTNSFTDFLPREQFLKELKQTVDSMRLTIDGLDYVLDSNGLPVKKDTFHFLTKILQPRSRIERTFFHVLLDRFYRNEIISAGSSWISLQFAIGLLSEFFKYQEVLERTNENELLELYEKLFTTEIKTIIQNHHFHLREEYLESYLQDICLDDRLTAAIKQTLLIGGLESKIHIEEGKQDHFIVEAKSGYNFTSVKPFKFMFDKTQPVWEVENSKVMIVDGLLESVSELDKIMIGAFQKQIPLLLIAHGFSEEVVATIKVNNDAKKFNIMPVRLTPDLESLNVGNDIAVACNTDLISTLKGQMVSLVEFDSLPIVDKVRVTPNFLNIENSKSKGAVAVHLKMLLDKRQAQTETVDITDLIDKRIQSLLNSSVTIHLPNLPATTKEAFKVKIDVCLRTCKTLVNFGLVNVHSAICDLCEDAENDLEKMLRKNIKTAFHRIAAQTEKYVPSLSLYAGTYLIGKAILSLCMSSGLVKTSQSS